MGYRTTKSKIKVESSKTNSYTEFCYHAFRNILLVSIPLLILSALILGLSTSHSFAVGSGSSGTDNIQLVLSTSCTVNAVVTSEHTVSLNGGQLDNNVGNTKLSAYCNDNNGYSIYAVGSSGDIDGNTDLVNTVNESYNIHTGVYNDTIQTNPSSWAMKLTAGTGTGIDPTTGGSVPTTPPTIINGFDNYSIIPNVYTQVAKRSSGTSMTTDTSISGSYLDTTYQIYANSAQPAGTYNGEVKYVMMHPNNSSQTTIPDLKAAFAAAGKQPVYQDENGYYYAMQDMTSDICTSVARKGTSTATQLVDLRDNKLYWVAKLDDDKCWMTQNLDLEIGGTNTQPLTSNNTDISTDPNVYTSSGIYSDYTENNGVYTWNPVSTAITSSTKITYNSSSYPPVSPAFPSDDSGLTTPYSAEGGDAYYYTSNNNNNDTRTTLANCISAGHTENECKHYSAGNYYNWTAAIASNNSTAINPPEEIAANSICPKGWRLPNASRTDNVNNEFGIMLYKAGITAGLSNGGESVGYITDGFNKLRSSPYYFVRSSHIYRNVVDQPGQFGKYWSNIAYIFNFGVNIISPNQNFGRSQGASIRCTAR